MPCETGRLWRVASWALFFGLDIFVSLLRFDIVVEIRDCSEKNEILQCDRDRRMPTTAFCRAQHNPAQQRRKRSAKYILAFSERVAEIGARFLWSGHARSRWPIAVAAERLTGWARVSDDCSMHCALLSLQALSWWCLQFNWLCDKSTFRLLCAYLSISIRNVIALL